MYGEVGNAVVIARGKRRRAFTAVSVLTLQERRLPGLEREVESRFVPRYRWRQSFR